MCAHSASYSDLTVCGSLKTSAGQRQPLLLIILLTSSLVVVSDCLLVCKCMSVKTDCYHLCPGLCSGILQVSPCLGFWLLVSWLLQIIILHAKYVNMTKKICLHNETLMIWYSDHYAHKINNENTCVWDTSCGEWLEWLPGVTLVNSLLPIAKTPWIKNQLSQLCRGVLPVHVPASSDRVKELSAHFHWLLLEWAVAVPT